MTATTATVTHEDPTLRVRNGITFAHDEYVTGNIYCLECHREVEPVVLVTVLNDEEWDYADDDSSTHCGVCLSGLVCAPQDAGREEREAASDAAAEYRHDAEKERGW